MNEKDVGHLFQEEPIDYNQFRIEGENVFCIKCGKSEELERIVIRRFKE